MANCECNSKTDYKDACVPSDPTWDLCPEKIRTTAFSLELLQRGELGISEKYYDTGEIKYLVKENKTIDSIMKRFKLTKREFYELIGYIVHRAYNCES